MQTKSVLKNVIVLASSSYALPSIIWLAQNKLLAGVVVPDASELSLGALEAQQLWGQLREADIPVEVVCKEKLSLIPSHLVSFSAQLLVSITFPHKLPLSLTEHYTFGAFNFHPSKLPNYAGPNPLYWQIRNREIESAISVHSMTQTFDKGEVVFQKDIHIDPLDTYLCLGNRISHESSLALAEFITFIRETGEVPSKPYVADIQSKELHGAPRVTLENRVIDFNLMSPLEITAICRAGNGQNQTSLVDIKGITVSVLQASEVDYTCFGTKPGTILFVGDPEGLIVCARGGAVRLDVIGSNDGIYSGFIFSERFQLDAGKQFSTPLIQREKQA